MSLLQTIKNDQLQARKDRLTAKASLLTTLYSEASMTGLNDGKRESTDPEVTATIKKFLKNVEESISVASPVVATQLLLEKKILEGYLPTQLTEEQITNIVTTLISEIQNPTKNDVGNINKALKAQYSGQYDGKVASEIIKSLLG